MSTRAQASGITALRRPWLIAGKAGSAALLLAVGAGCGGDDEESSEESCDEVDEIESTFAEIADVDVSEDGPDQIGAIARDLADEVEDLADQARGELEDEVDALESAVDDLIAVVDDGGDASVEEQASDIVDRLGEVGAAVVDLADAAADVC